MKKTLFFPILLALLLSCEDNNETFCWKYTVRVSTTINSKTTSVITENTQCGLTEDDANKVKESLNSTSKSTQGGYTAIIETKVISMNIVKNK